MGDSISSERQAPEVAAPEVTAAFVPPARVKRNNISIDLNEATAHAANPTITKARYHGDGRRTLKDDYDVQETVLGSGWNGAVVLALGRLDKRRYAIKRIGKRALKRDKLLLLKQEAEIYLALDHPNIAKLHDVYESDEDLALVMECCTGGELFDRLEERVQFTEFEAAETTRQMLHAVGYLHAHNVVHRDLKLENFLLESKEKDADLKLIDFGFSKIWDPGMPLMRACCGSIAYVSPDVLAQNGYTSKCDLWSIGVIVFMLLTGYAPFHGDDNSMRKQIKAADVHWRSEIELSKDAEEFVRSLLTVNPKFRLDAKKALAHPWLQRTAVEFKSPKFGPKTVKSLRNYAQSSRVRRAVLQLLAQELLPEETKELRDTFLKLDKESTGTISLRVLTDAVRGRRATPGGDDASIMNSFVSYVYPAPVPATPTTPSLPPRASSDEILSLFAVLDSNGDEQIYYSDFLAATLEARSQLREEVVRRTFARLDCDGSGAISAADLRDSIGETFEGVDAVKLLQESEITLDGRGEVSYEAFSRLLERRDLVPSPQKRRNNNFVKDSLWKATLWEGPDKS